jgi:hypothetical protein
MLEALGKKNRQAGTETTEKGNWQLVKNAGGWK